MKEDVVPLKELTLNGGKVPANQKIRIDTNIAEAWIMAALAKRFSGGNEEAKPKPAPGPKK